MKNGYLWIAIGVMISLLGAIFITAEIAGQNSVTRYSEYLAGQGRLENPKPVDVSMAVEDMFVIHSGLENIPLSLAMYQKDPYKLGWRLYIPRAEFVCGNGLPQPGPDLPNPTVVYVHLVTDGVITSTATIDNWKWDDHYMRYYSVVDLNNGYVLDVLLHVDSNECEKWVVQVTARKQ